MQDATRNWWGHLLKRDRSSLFRLLVVAVLGVVLLWWGGGGKKSSATVKWMGSAATAGKPLATASPTPLAATQLSQEESWMDGQLVNILSAIPGSGKVSVAVTLSRGVENRYAPGQSGSSSTSSNAPLVLNNLSGAQSLALLDEMGPEVQGVVVVAAGATSPTVRQEIQQAVSTLFQLQAYQVLVLPVASVAGNP